MSTSMSAVLPANQSECRGGGVLYFKKKLIFFPLQVIFGPMFSGKTTELIRRLKRYEVANHKCLIIKVILTKYQISVIYASSKS